MGNKSATTTVDGAVATHAARRHGVFSLTDVVDLGMTRKMLTARVAAGRLFRLHQGVYSVVPPRLLKIEGRWLAAVLACGPESVLSHTAAAALWDIRGIPSGAIHVSVPNSTGRAKRRGITIHRTSTLLPSQTTLRRSIPVTSSARTLSDLRRTLPLPQYDAALRKAEIRHLDTDAAGGQEPGMTAFEQRLIALCRRHGLPMPRAQQIIGPYTVDFLWPDARLIAEMDDFKTHGTKSAFESDRARDAWLTANGCRVLRFTWRQVQDDPVQVVAVLRRALGA